MAKTSAHVMALSVGVDPKAFRAALAKQKFAWHADGADWSVETNGPEHTAMIAVLRPLFAATAMPTKTRPAKTTRTRKPKASAVVTQN